MPLSSTTTSTPERASHQPALSPVTPPPTMTTDAPCFSLMAWARSFAGRRLVLGMGRRLLPMRQPLRRDVEPADPIVAHRLRLLVRPENAQGQRPDRRAIGGEGDLADGNAARRGEQHLHLLAAAPSLARPHAGAGQALHLILVQGPVLGQRLEIARLQLRGAPAEIAWRAQLDELAPRHLLALADHDVPAADRDRRVEPAPPVAVLLPAQHRRRHRRIAGRAAEAARRGGARPR